MDQDQLAALLAAAKDIALAAGRAIREISLEPQDIRDKADGSPLTRADLASHEVIVAGLEPLRPAFPILSEEGDLTAAEQGGWETFWCVDPLDGTKEFIRGFPDYTVNIALVQHAEPILGVVYAPAAAALFWAARGTGAHKRADDGPDQPIAAATSDSPATAVVSRSHLSPETKTYLDRLGVREMVQRGSSVKICAVAEGSADIYPRLGPTCVWDTAAGSAVAREAGCRVIDLQGAALSYDPAEGLKRPGFIVLPRNMNVPLP